MIGLLYYFIFQQVIQTIKMKKYAYSQQQMNMMAVDPATGAIVVKRHRNAREALSDEDFGHYARILESIETLKV